MTAYRQSLSIFQKYHWKESFWNGHYIQLIKWWGITTIFKDSWNDIKRLLKK